MADTQQILTEFAQQVASQQRIYDCTNVGSEALNFAPAISNAAEQIDAEIKAAEDKRGEEVLELALDIAGNYIENIHRLTNECWQTYGEKYGRK